MASPRWDENESAVSCHPGDDRPAQARLHGFRQIVDALSEDLGSAKGSDLITDVLFIAGRD
jgi:hypothetical protein